MNASAAGRPIVCILPFMARTLDFEDRLIAILDGGLRTLFAASPAVRPSPAEAHDEAPLTNDERHRSAALMRVNHAGEISAQALYLGQSLLARSDLTHDQLLTAAAEEHDHLAWCRTRLDELAGRPSVLDPLWFAGSAMVGVLVGAAGDRISLGFVAETERQVEAHIEDHLGRLPRSDVRSTAVLERMAEDEARHGTMATRAGGETLPRPLPLLMSVCGGFLRRTALFL
jgi:ubiquinone biosynthesis monooxygenase Coq7